MLFYPFKNRFNRGIGLLELMLVLSIIAIFLVMALRYFAVATRARQVKDAIQVTQVIYNAGQKWLDDVGDFEQKPAVCSGGTLLSCFAELGFVPKEYAPDGKNANPWGGTITAKSADADNRKLEAIFTLVPNNLCNNIKNKLLTTATVTCSDKDDTMDVIY